MSQHIYLTGYRGTGKTSVGAIVAQTLGRPLIDLDQVIEQDAGMSIREIFEEGGESMFRDLESKSLFAVPPTPPVVVSLGGGAILRKENRQWIRANGFCVWLDAAPATLAERIAQDASTGTRRPALTDLDGLQEIRQLLSQRRPFYQELADCRIETDAKTIQEVARQVLVHFPCRPSE